MRSFVFLIKFLLLGAFFVISYQGPDSGGLPLVEEGNIKEFGKLYADWLSGIGGNVATLTGYVADAEWLPEPVSPEDDSVEAEPDRTRRTRR